MQDLQLKLSEIIKQLKEQIAGIRGGRPNPKLIEDIGVEYFGQKLTVKQLGSINIVPPTTIQISTWDKNAVSAIAKAIESSNLNVSANTEGNLIKINLQTEKVEITEDDKFKSKEEIQKAVDKTNEEIEKILENKIKEIEE